MKDTITSLINPSLQQLVKEIHAVNHAWKIASECGEIYAISKSLQQMKTRLQMRLLRSYAPHQVYLILDQDTESEEPLYGLRLREAVNGCKDAAHLPVRVANKILTTEQIEQFKSLK
ncbi:hypothetical protein PN462_02850 [Spirulina sp. CS-785/01]|uniref:hypothetical protein n=1 Tax=Spirulina sp. CS-785/01 TaxID=3021716 RepID=UPI00232E0354|nr:hypothetical protein [Spirulina sp. CS-785/01]MDB9312025.1 hypothetical protein [Spirulina sp. CS-785/01]